MLKGDQGHSISKGKLAEQVHAENPSATDIRGEESVEGKDISYEKSFDERKSSGDK